MLSKLDQLRQMTVVVADTGDIYAIKAYQPVDCTTNPTLILKASHMPEYRPLVMEAIAWGKRHNASVLQVTDHLAVSFGVELTKIVPGRVSTEVDADLSFDIEGSISKARNLITDYESRGVARTRILIKLATTWEGIQAAKILQQEQIDCNMTLVFSLSQAIACAQAKVFLISPFVGRILDWNVKNTGISYSSSDDPGVISVKSIYEYYKANEVKTLVMGASFRNKLEIEALAGCDRLTIAPALLQQLGEDHGVLVRELDPDTITRGEIPIQPMDEKEFRWQLNENAMASEKLSEGIRLFAKDLRSLQKLLSQCS